MFACIEVTYAQKNKPQPKPQPFTEQLWVTIDTVQLNTVLSSLGQQGKYTGKTADGRLLVEALVKDPGTLTIHFKQEIQRTYEYTVCTVTMTADALFATFNNEGDKRTMGDVWPRLVDILPNITNNLTKN